MLVLSRKSGQKIVIGSKREITLTILRITPDSISIGIDAPTETPIYREELLEEMERSNLENRASSGNVDVKSLKQSLPVIRRRQEAGYQEESPLFERNYNRAYPPSTEGYRQVRGDGYRSNAPRPYRGGGYQSNGFPSSPPGYRQNNYPPSYAPQNALRYNTSSYSDRPGPFSPGDNRRPISSSEENSSSKQLD